MKSNSPNHNASVHDFHSLQIFVIFKRSLPIPKTYSVVLSSKIFYLSHLPLQSIWNSFCLWNKVGIKGFFCFQQEYPVPQYHLLERSNPTALLCPLISQLTIEWFSGPCFVPESIYISLKPIPHCCNYSKYTMGLDI